VPLVKEPVEVAGTPSDDSFERCAQGREYAPNQAKLDLACVASLDAGNRGLVAADPRGEIGLAPTLLTAEGAAYSTYPKIIHHAIVLDGASPPVHRQCTASSSIPESERDADRCGTA
jgi:hypothetical protein